MPKRHQHADAIHAWAEGAEIEFRVNSTRIAYGSSNDWKPCRDPDWHENFEYRVKGVEELSAEQITAKLFLLKHGLGNTD